MLRANPLGMNPETNQPKASASEKISHLADDMKRSANEFVHDAGNKVGGALGSANEKAADFKHRAEQTYEERLSPRIDAGQEHVAGASRYLQNKSLPDFLADLESCSRQHPRITAVVSFLLGWKLGRALTFGK